jgi:hypothetical protein
MSAPLTLTRPTMRIAGACGVASAVLVIAAPSVPTPDVASTVWVLGWLLLLPFLAGVATLARDSGGPAAWLAPAIPAAGAVLVAVHLATVGVEYTANNMSKSSPVHEPLHDIGGALFIVGMLPFGVALVAVAVTGLVGRALPRWLSGAALVIGGIALVNGTMLGSESAWGFLLSTVWVLAAGITLAARRPVPITVSEPSAAAA